MDWMFYLILLIVLFSIITVIGTVRYIVNRRIERREKKLQLEKEAQQIAESNSGL
jgi:Flp pilus assembly protein TadB